MINNVYLRKIDESSDIEGLSLLKNWINFENGERVKYYRFINSKNNCTCILILDNIFNVYLFKFSRYNPVVYMGFVYSWDRGDYEIKSLIRWAKDNVI